MSLPNLYRAMRDAGYDVLACGKFDLLKGAMDWGLDGQHGDALRRLGFTGGIDSAGKHDCLIAANRGLPEPYAHFLSEAGLFELHARDFAERHPPIRCYTNITPSPLPDDAYCDNWIGARALDLLKAVPAGKPWFMQINFAGPHEPLDVTEAMLHLYDHVDFPLPVNNHRIEPDSHQAMRRNYAAMIENIDAWVGKLVAAVAARGEQDNTLIVYASDHGDELGDNDQWHKCLPTHGSIHVPLIIAGPGVHAGHVTTPVDLVDLHATLVDLTGAERVAAGAGSGESLSHALRGGELGWAARSSGLGGWRTWFDGRYKYVHNHHGGLTARDVVPASFDTSVNAPALLIDLGNDPGEQHDISVEQPAIAARMRSELLAEVAACTTNPLG